MKPNKTIYLLIGAKGSGKSFIGSLFQKHFGIAFIRVEDWAKQVKKDRDVLSDDYVREVFTVIEKGITQEMQQHNAIVFESTGVTEHFKTMVYNLMQKFNVVQIFVEADLELCLKRVKTRDQSIHINVSDEQVNQINQAVNKANHTIDYCIENSNKTKIQIVRELEAYLARKG